MRAMELPLRCSWCRAERPYSQPRFTSTRLLYSRCLQRQPRGEGPEELTTVAVGCVRGWRGVGGRLEGHLGRTWRRTRQPNRQMALRGRADLGARRARGDFLAGTWLAKDKRTRHPTGYRGSEHKAQQQLSP